MGWFQRYGIPGTYVLVLTIAWAFALYPELALSSEVLKVLLGGIAVALLPTGYLISITLQLVYLRGEGLHTKALADLTNETTQKFLSKLAETFPAADDTPEALLQLGNVYEFSGKIAEARRWYQKLIDGHADTGAGLRAAGAFKRLDPKGEPFESSASGLKGGTIDAD